jgi:hypothetical protein
MLYFLRKLRRNLLSKSTIWSYLLYALSEVALVVLGILIAVEIDNRNEKQKALDEELASYEDIISDLRKDSLQFATLLASTKRHMDIYYQVYNELSGNSNYTDSILYCLVLGATHPFSPLTEKNHRVTIDKINNVEIRDALNSYFVAQYSVNEAVDEKNGIIITELRPYLFRNSVIDANKVFHDNTYGFFPNDGDITNYRQLREAYKDPDFFYQIAEARLSTGLIIASLNNLLRANHELIVTLDQSLTSD